MGHLGFGWSLDYDTCRMMGRTEEDWMTLFLHDIYHLLI
jgi:hypothetical protein